VIQEVRGKIIGNEDVRPSVVVIIANDHSQRFTGDALNSGRLAVVGERTVSIEG
jgi:hypothetical protein